MDAQTHTAVVEHDGGGWIGSIEEVPGVNGQQAIREELVESLRVARAEALEFSRGEARAAAGRNHEGLGIAV